MLQKQSSHFKIFYQPNSLAEKEIDSIIQKIEGSYCFVLQTLKIQDSFPRINYFLYPDNKTKLAMMGDDGNANARQENFSVHGIYNQKIKIVGRHELVHLLANGWGNPPELFRQGLAEAMEEKWHDQSHHQWVKDFLNNKQFIALVDLIDDQKFCQSLETVTYPESGSFIKFLLNQYGLDKIKELCNRLDKKFAPTKNIKILEDLLQKSIGDSEHLWLSLATII